MITIVAKNIVKKDKLDEFKKLAAELTEGSIKEEGCISYVLHEDINNPCILTFIENWTDQKAIAIHNATTHFTTIAPQFSGLVEEAMQINLYKAL
ncbi:MAG TPA: putative quinol monooxygenase [Ruminiclostridium sp.]